MIRAADHGADRTEQAGPGVASIARRTRAGAAARPDPGQGALLADPVERAAFNRPGTRSQAASRPRARAAPPAPARRTLVERLLRLRIAHRVLRPHRQAGEAEPAQQLADRALVQLDVVAGLDQRLQVDPPPADHAVPRRVRSLLDDLFQFPHLLGREARLAPRPGPVVQAGESFRVVTVHPVPQRLSIHPGHPCRRLARAALEHQSQRQHAPRGCRPSATYRLASQLGRAQLPPCHRHCHPSLPGQASIADQRCRLAEGSGQIDASGDWAAGITRRVASFQANINQQPCVVADRLWVKDRLDPDEEKLRFSN